MPNIFMGEDIEIKWTVDQLLGMGYLKGNRESFTLSDTGINEGYRVLETLPMSSRILLMILIPVMVKVSEEEE